MIQSQNAKIAPRVAIYTLGCKVNQYESQAIAEDFEKLGCIICQFENKCDIYVINTCTVTAESDKKSRQMIRRARKLGGPDAIIVAVGCFTQAQGEKLISLTELDAAFGNQNKSKTAFLAYELFCNGKKPFENNVSDISKAAIYDNMQISYSERTRAFVKIVDGCENKCTYCIIPSVRGPIRSRSVEAVVDELNTLAKAGYKEVVLTGIETADYGKDIGISLGTLLCEADNIDGICRIRLGSLEPTLFKDDFISTLSTLKNIVPHFHLSLQSGSDAILRGMKRRYNTRMFLDYISKLKSTLPNVTLTTDIIVGFPGETDEMFNETVEFIKKCGFLYVHIFPYSKRAGTVAACMNNQVDDSTKKHRAATLKEVMLKTRKNVLKEFDGFLTDVLFEECDENGFYQGHTPNYIEAKLVSFTQQKLDGQIRKCRLIYDENTVDYMRCELID